MVAKVLGLASGALVASLAVWAFNDWRHVSDEDRLTSVLGDHCLPYVRTGVTPFEGMGRGPGVYDEVDLDETLTTGSVLLIHDARFLAQWGVAQNAGPDGDTTFRVCKVDPTYSSNTVAGFVVRDDGFIDRYSNIISPDGALVADTETMPSGPSVIGWYNQNGTQSDGLRVVMVAGAGLVSSVVVATNLPD